MTKAKAKTEQTRDRIIQAAIAVFSQAGVAGATTREIARVAEVNEVTLFRHFKSKEQLLQTVAENITRLATESLAHQEEWTQDLHRDLLHYGQLYDEMLENSQGLIRMFIGEAKRHPDEALQVVQYSFVPLREQLIAYLHNGIEKGTVRPDINPPLVVDQFTGMLLAGMLRRHISSIPRGYDRLEYVKESVNMFVINISANKEIKQGKNHERS